MRHLSKKYCLQRKSAPRKALMRGLACSLILHDKIVTTRAKAKALRPFIEPLVTKARKAGASKMDNMVSRRYVFSRLMNKKAVKKLFSDVVVWMKDRPGGYVQIIPLPNRLGDGATVSLVKWVRKDKIE